MARRSKFENNAAAGSPRTSFAGSFLVVAAVVGRAVDRAFAVQHEATVRVGTVARLLPGGDPCEAVQYSLHPFAVLCSRRNQLEYCSAVLIERITRSPLAPAINRGSVKIARCVKNQVACWDIALLGGWKAVKNRLGPGLAFLLWWR